MKVVENINLPILMFILIQVRDYTKHIIDYSFHDADNDSALVQAFPDVDAGA